jgi:hypothetical protein
MRSAVLALLTTLTVWLSMQPSALACKCAPPDLHRSYASADHVLHVRVLSSLGATRGQRYYLGVTSGVAFKGCLADRSFVLIQTAADLATCGVTLSAGSEYLLEARDAGRSFGLQVLQVNGCDDNFDWGSLESDDLTFLNTRSTCCGDRCTCTASQLVDCLVDPCQLSSCEVDGATCMANYCGGCHAEWTVADGARVCAPTAPTVCHVDGCSGQLCLAVGDPADITDCSLRAEYACYASATCESQVDGRCGWTSTPELTACLAATP